MLQRSAECDAQLRSAAGRRQAARRTCSKRHRRGADPLRAAPEPRRRAKSARLSASMPEVHREHAASGSRERRASSSVRRPDPFAPTSSTRPWRPGTQPLAERTLGLEQGLAGQDQRSQRDVISRAGEYTQAAARSALTGWPPAQKRGHHRVGDNDGAVEDRRALAPRGAIACLDEAGRRQPRALGQGGDQARGSRSARRRQALRETRPAAPSTRSRPTRRCRGARCPRRAEARPRLPAGAVSASQRPKSSQISSRGRLTGALRVVARVGDVDGSPRRGPPWPPEPRR
jgi:hypothetical protein